ncbi:DctP family TRAP transporter solute-binding subunit [Oceanobacillus sp. Castelsardo]|uniref:DctP family TRAP transporter solute-binding subunit n=1 Tax=Oceanobacillus sp. Castelsardo TaxID=1851204 RepID=UPI000837F8DC|nr:DctP family TRAP transporter solute-binding subunit [Oceanobacillus sp. Castelsardo]
MKKLRNILIAFTILLTGSLAGVFLFTSDVVQSDDTIIIRFGHGAAETNERHMAVMEFKKLVEERSSGNMEVIVYPNEQLGSEAEMVESVTFNDLQMVAAATFNQYDQRISAFELPYLFPSAEVAYRVLDGEVGQKIGDPLLEDNLRILAYFENGFRNITSNVPINTPEDLDGIKIRTPEVPVAIDTFRALGANPTPMAFGELYMALQQGTVDAQENPVANIYATKFNEVQAYLNLTSHQYTPLPVAISDDFWNSLSKENQDIIQKSSLDAAQFHRDLLKENEAKMIEELQAAGMEVVKPDPEPFREAVSGVYDKYRAVFGDELIDMLQDATKEDID